jgi:hypothetical protein
MRASPSSNEVCFMLETAYMKIFGLYNICMIKYIPVTIALTGLYIFVLCSESAF